MRRRATKKKVTPSLFPFLAVLICTMGALIMVLVLTVEQARVSAAAESAAKQLLESDAREQLVHAEQDQLWRRDILLRQREEKTSSLETRRLELSHLEEHIRRLEDNWKSLRRRAEELARLASNDQLNTEQARSLRDKLRRDIEFARRKLAQAQDQAARRKRSFAVIPYDGPNGTLRRPIYIECTAKAVIIQPEGIELKPSDFIPPLGPGNPLVATLRATREYWARYGATQQQGEPYPLLIVRPGGAVSYSKARGAMESWDDQFGYELVESDVELSYPPADDHLKKVLRQSVAEARQRQAILAAASGRGGRGSNRGLRATPHRGGFVSQESGDRETGFESPRGGNQKEQPDPATTTSEEKQTENRFSKASASQNSSADAPPSQSAGNSSVRPLAGMRGNNWALPGGGAPGATGITRPMAVSCYQDRLVIHLRGNGSSASTKVALEGPLEPAIDQFVSSIWEHVDTWGIAVVGGYWKPVLQVEVDRGGELRFAELQTLMQGSGIDVQRR